MQRKIKKILGYSVDLFTFREAIDYVITSFQSGKNVHVVTINPEMIEMGNKNQELGEVLRNADLVIPDGSGIKLALKLNGINQEQIPGIEFAKKMLILSAEMNIPVALIGTKQEILDKSCKNLSKEISGLNIAYKHNGFFKDEEKNNIINEISLSGAKLILVALGVPKQEYFIEDCKEVINNAIFIGIGGSFDVWSGEIKRAPLIFRKLWCEWLYRTITQPSRFKRIFPTLPRFLINVIIEVITSK